MHLQMPNLQALSFQNIANCPGVVGGTSFNSLLPCELCASSSVSSVLKPKAFISRSVSSADLRSLTYGIRANSFIIRTYRQVPRFALFWPELPARKPFRIRTSTNSICSHFRIRTSEKRWGEGSSRLANRRGSRRAPDGV
jgi:hypothetical protein